MEMVRVLLEGTNLVRFYLIIVSYSVCIVVQFKISETFVLMSIGQHWKSLLFQKFFVSLASCFPRVK